MFTTDRRHELQALLEQLLGSPNVYFQPPANLIMKYPCIIYNRDGEERKYAGNFPYNRVTKYTVTVVAGNPDNDIVKAVGELPLTNYSRFYVASNLNHDVFTIYF